MFFKVISITSQTTSVNKTFVILNRNPFFCDSPCSQITIIINDYELYVNAHLPMKRPIVRSLAIARLSTIRANNFTSTPPRTRWSGASPHKICRRGRQVHQAGPISQILLSESVSFRGDFGSYPYDLDETPAPSSTGNSMIPPLGSQWGNVCNVGHLTGNDVIIG